MSLILVLSYIYYIFKITVVFIINCIIFCSIGINLSHAAYIKNSDLIHQFKYPLLIRRSQIDHFIEINKL
jgi:hypothetical protein